MSEETTTEPTEPADDADQTESSEEASVTEPTVEDELSAAIADRDQNYDRWIRAQAELDNARKRWRKETEESAKYRSVDLAVSLLPALDNLGRAIDAAENSSSIEDLVAGLRMVAQQFQDILSASQIVPIPAEPGTEFDPAIHEAVSQFPTDDQPPMTIVQEAEQGWQLAERVLRPAKVVVATSK